MLYDKGLATEEQIKASKEFFAEWPRKNWGGCISSRICENCSHIISDSLCLCCGVFTCPNCQYRNGKDIEKMIEEMRRIPVASQPFQFYVDGVTPIIDQPESFQI